jgi:hypothetical protein
LFNLQLPLQLDDFSLQTLVVKISLL